MTTEMLTYLSNYMKDSKPNVERMEKEISDLEKDIKKLKIILNLKDDEITSLKSNNDKLINKISKLENIIDEMSF